MYNNTVLTMLLRYIRAVHLDVCRRPHYVHRFDNESRPTIAIPKPIKMLYPSGTPSHTRRTMTCNDNNSPRTQAVDAGEEGGWEEGGGGMRGGRRIGGVQHHLSPDVADAPPRLRCERDQTDALFSRQSGFYLDTIRHVEYKNISFLN